MSTRSDVTAVLHQEPEKQWVFSGGAQDDNGIYLNVAVGSEQYVIHVPLSVVDGALVIDTATMTSA